MSREALGANAPTTEMSSTSLGAAAEAPDVDPITLGVISGALESIINEMGAVVRRTARSPVLAIGNDFSNALFDASPRLAAQGAQQPVHVGGMMGALKGVVAFYGDEIGPGDVIYHNDPATKGSHLPDMTVYKPIWVDGEICFWAGCRCHMDETGGPVPGGYNPHAEDIYAEGLRIPPIKLLEGGRPRRDVLNLILTNLRTPEVRRGDLGAQITAVNLAERRLLRVLEKYGKATVHAAVSELLDRADAIVRHEIAEMPDGTYVGRSIIEDDGHGSGDMEIRAVVTISGEQMEVRLESPPQVGSYVNSYESNSRSGIYYGVVPFFSPTVPHNDGTYRSIAIDLGPLGSLVNAVEPAACGMSTGGAFGNIAEAVRDALAQAAPSRAAAGWSDCSGAIFSGVDPRFGEHYSYLSHLTFNGGGGASHGVNGQHCLGCLAAGGASMTGDIELVELRVPLHIRRYELVTDSACPGKWRGGLAPVVDAEIVDHDALLSTVGDGLKYPPPSLLGAESPYNRERVFRRYIVRDGRQEVFPPHTTRLLRAGERFLTYLPGGGGIGRPYDRPAEDVLWDVKNEMVSVERASGEYGVVIDADTLTLDLVESNRLRRS